MGFMTLLFHYDAITESDNRIGYTHNFTRFDYIYYPENKKINNHRFGLRTVFDFTTTDQDLFSGKVTVTYNLKLANTSAVEVKINREYGELFFPFDFTEAEPLPVGEYRWYFIGATYKSDTRKTFFFTIGLEAGGFYSGDRKQLSTDLNYRKQPWGNFAFRFVQNYLKFPQPFRSESLTLLGPKVEINMSRNLFWTTFLQYNTQRDNFNINSRVQWQFNPHYS